MRTLFMCGITLWAMLSTAYAAKPGVPLAIEVLPVGSVIAGQEARFKLTAVAQVPIEQLQITIRPIGKVHWRKGNTNWQGKAEAGVPVVMEFSVSVPVKGSFELHAVASTVGGKGGGFGARAVYLYSDPNEVTPAAKSRDNLRHGNKVIEIPVK